MKYSAMKVRLTGIEGILGSTPMNKQVYSEYIATKAKTEGQKKAAAEDVDNVIESDEKGITGFYRDAAGNIILKAYQIKGFFKEAGRALKDQLSLASCTSKVDNYVFISEREIIMRDKDGNPITSPDDYLERPLRGETAQGPRVSLAKSEYINPGWTLEFTIKVLENKKTAKSIPMNINAVKSFLDYGELKGLLQWRNAGYGAFTYEILEEN